MSADVCPGSVATPPWSPHHVVASQTSRTVTSLLLAREKVIDRDEPLRWVSLATITTSSAFRRFSVHSRVRPHPTKRRRPSWNILCSEVMRHVPLAVREVSPRVMLLGHRRLYGHWHLVALLWRKTARGLEARDVARRRWLQGSFTSRIRLQLSAEFTPRRRSRLGRQETFFANHHATHQDAKGSADSEDFGDS